MALAAADMAELLTVEVAFATPAHQCLVSLEVKAGTSVADAIEQSGIAAKFPADNLQELAVGIWGREVSRDQRLSDGDRIEIYRGLVIEPRDARRQLAEAGLTMKQGVRG
jgi:putative ubiquitin-RnfH superfamily antitoxin RatB of RatAB toxin-antitoxin module